jgi:hypothetical protein
VNHSKERFILSCSAKFFLEIGTHEKKSLRRSDRAGCLLYYGPLYKI